jgi:SNF2 family DNA or RNA helicase
MSHKNAILADDMGLGKTLQAIEAAKEMQFRNGLIISPLQVRHTWCKVLRDQHPTCFIKELNSVNSIPDASSFNVINYDIAWRTEMFKKLRDMAWDVLIADEAHYLKSHDSNRTRAILGRGGIYKMCAYRWMLTGTPVQNRPIELYPILRSLCPEEMGKFRDYYQYAYRYCGGYQSPFGFNVAGATRLDELATLLKNIMLRRTKEEVLPELPGLTFEKIYLDPTNKLRKIIDQETKTHIDEEVKSLRRALGLVKTAQAIKHIEDVVEMKGKVVVYTYHREVALEFQKYFGRKAVSFTGDQTLKEKGENLEKFISSPDIPVFIGQIDTAGTGLDGLQSVCDTCVFVEMSYVPGKILQAIDRLRRIGQHRPVLAQFLVAEGSMDEELVDESKEFRFVGAKCAVCQKAQELRNLKRVAGLTVCKDGSCETQLEVFV